MIEEENLMKKNIVIIVLTILVLCLGGYLVCDKTIDSDKDSLDKITNENEIIEKNQNENLQLTNYDLEAVSKIILRNICTDCTEPDYVIVEITDKGEIKSILSKLDKVKLINKMDSVGLNNLFNIEIEYNGDPSTKIFFLDNGNLAINYSVGVGETSYAQYTIEYSNLKDELISTYY